METAGTIEILNARASTPEKAAGRRFFDTALTGVTAETTGAAGMTAEQITYVGMNTTALVDNITGLVATFNTHIIATPPTGFSQLTEGDFQVYINGVLIPTQNRVTAQSGANITVTFSELGFTLDNTDQIIIVGKFS
jgi:hypothetical protein